jgi:hypothetical protein
VTALELIQELAVAGVKPHATRDGTLELKPASRVPSVLVPALQSCKPELMAFLEGRMIQSLPRHLEPLVRAASTGVLPRGAMHLESGIAPDFQEHVTAWALAYLLGDRQHVLERLTQASRAWEASRLN